MEYFLDCFIHRLVDNEHLKLLLCYQYMYSHFSKQNQVVYVCIKDQCLHGNRWGNVCYNGCEKILQPLLPKLSTTYLLWTLRFCCFTVKVSSPLVMKILMCFIKEKELFGLAIDAIRVSELIIYKKPVSHLIMFNSYNIFRCNHMGFFYFC